MLKSHDPEKSVRIGDHYSYVVNDEVTDLYEVRIYKIIDIGKIDGNLYVNVRFLNIHGKLNESAILFEKFYYLIQKRIIKYVE